MMRDLPNILTLSRIGAIPVLVLLVAVGAPWADLLASLLFGAAAITDYLDGRLAREMLQESFLLRPPSLPSPSRGEGLPALRPTLPPPPLRGA